MLNLIKQLIKFTFFASIFVIVGVVSAQSSDAAKKYGVTFPVAELGNCASVGACRTYCDDQTHREQCNAFAKKKGFYKEPSANNNNNTIIQKAKAELGCTDQASCNQYCSQEANRQKCRDFAQRNNLETPDRKEGGPGPGNQNILQKAKEILGCDSEASCRAICEQAGNREKCSRFAKEAGVEGGTRRVGPGGCDSEESCRSYCDTHQDECRKFGGGPNGEMPGDGGKGPDNGGKPVCTTNEECQAFCKNPANAEVCKNVVVQQENKGPSSEEIQQQMGGLRQNILQMPEESQACLRNALGDAYNKIMAGEPLTTPIDGGAMQACFSQGVKERDEKNTPTSIPDDYRPDSGQNGIQPNNSPPISVVPPETPPTQPPSVQGISIRNTFIDIVINYLQSLKAR